MSKDMLVDKYGRLYELPKHWAESGHDVHVVCLSYKRGKDQVFDKAEFANLQCSSRKLGINPVYGLIKHYLKLCELAETVKPDVIVGASDCFHVILASLLSRKTSIPYVVDLYDNFESFGASFIPGVRKSFSVAVKKANAVVPISDNLKEYVINKYLPIGEVEVINNAINSDVFNVQDKVEARKLFDLPTKGIFIGHAGHFTRRRGIDILIKGFEQLQQQYKDIHLVLAGPIDSSINIEVSDQLHYLGNLPYSKIPSLLNTLDVGIICNKDDEFGKYCFPQKAYEMLSCRIPIVAADTGAMSNLFLEYQDSLYKPDDVNSFVAAIRSQINFPEKIELNIPDWREQANKFSVLIASILNSH